MIGFDSGSRTGFARFDNGDSIRELKCLDGMPTQLLAAVPVLK